MKMPEEEFDELEELEVKPVTSKKSVPISIKDAGILLSDSTLTEDSEELDEEEPIRPGERTRAGHVMGNDGKEKKSDGREVVDGVESAAKIAAVAASGGGAAAAGEGAAAGAAAKGGAAASGATTQVGQAGANAAKGGTETANNITNATKKSKSALGNGNSPVTKKAMQEAYENLKDQVADKIDEKAEKNPILKEKLKDAAVQAKKLNSAVKTVGSAMSGNIKGAVEGAKDYVKAVIEEKLRLLKKFAIIALIAFFAVALIISAIEAYIESAIAVLDKPATAVANTHEKIDNFLNGLGFQNSEDAFYEELNKLNKDHNYELNIPIIMATLYYDEMHTEGDVGLEDTTESDGDSSKVVALTLASRFIKQKVKESNETIGADSLRYSSNKIYRLRKLARNQFDNPIFGKGTNAEEHSVSVLEYLNLIQGNIDKELFELLKSQFENVVSLANPANTAESIYQIFAGDEVFTTTDTGAHLEDMSNNLIDLLDAIFSPFFDISGISLYGSDGCDHVVCVKYKTYGYDEDAYFNYLKKYYIRYMPEFKKYISSSSEKNLDKEIDKIITEIKETAENYEDIFGVYKTTTESYENSESCAGNIKQSIIGDMQKPVAIVDDVAFSGKYAYGASDGTSHKGVDLNETTAGIKAGMKVFSVHSDGTVLESTADNTYSDSSVKGGWVKIQYGSTSGGEAYMFSIIYGGLEKSSLKLKKGDKVKKGATIGKVGSKAESEDGDMPSLHFGFYDDTTNTYMDPTNLFVPCTGGYTASTYLLHDTTSISEENFVKAINEYCKKNTCNSTLKNWNLNAVFKYAVNNKVNPRLVVVRAILEGFSPGGSKYNYWGIGCYNGCNSCCTSYGSLEAGVKGFANVGSIKNGKTIADMMATYAYLGDVWYNPGSSSLGGCYYHTYIDKYMTASRKKEVNSICAASRACSGSSCTKTTKEDKDAYVEWQCEKIIETDKKIFGDYVQVANSSSPSGGGGSSAKTTKSKKGDSSKTEQYVQEAIDMANNDKIGYSQSTRYLNPNVDCSSMVYMSLLNTGIIKGKKTDAFTTYTMGGVLTKNGFKQYKYKKDILKRGDILVDVDKHTVIYIGDGKQVAANGCQTPPRSCSKNGDQADEVSVSNYSGGSYDYIYRLE